MNGQELYINIVDHGQYFNPASKHYPNIKNPTISCDRCNKIVTSCIGWKTYDVCLDCANEISSLTANETSSKDASNNNIIRVEEEIKTFMQQNIFDCNKPPANVFMPSPADPFSNYAPFEGHVKNEAKEQEKKEKEKRQERERIAAFYANGGMVTRMMPGQFATKMMQNQYYNN